jgi:hypothetical protein
MIAHHPSMALTSGDNLPIIGVHGVVGDLFGADGIEHEVGGFDHPATLRACVVWKGRLRRLK